MFVAVSVVVIQLAVVAPTLTALAPGQAEACGDREHACSPRWLGLAVGATCVTGWSRDWPRDRVRWAWRWRRRRAGGDVTSTRPAGKAGGCGGGEAAGGARRRLWPWWC